MDLNKKIFKDLSFNDLLTRIWDNSVKKEEQISDLIKQLAPMVKEPGDAMIIVPLLKEYMEVAIKNDEQLIKMAAIVQKAMMNNEEDENNLTLSEKDRNDLYDNVKRLSAKN